MASAVTWVMLRLHCFELPYLILTRFKYSTLQHPAAWPWWASLFFAVIRACATKIQTMGQLRFVGRFIQTVIPLQMILVKQIKVTTKVQFKVRLDMLLRPERATLAELRAHLRQQKFSDDPMNPSPEYLASMHPRSQGNGEPAPLANLPEEVGTIHSDGTYKIRGEWIEALVDPKHPDPRPRSKTVVLYFHGGGHVFCSPRTHTHLLACLARDVGPGTRVFSVDYRMAPEHPFPAAIHDAFAAYLYLTEPDHAALMLDEDSATQELAVDPRDVVVAGDSAGGNLAVAFMHYMARYVQPSTEPRFILPHAMLLLSAWTDVSSSVPSAKSNDWYCYCPGPIGTSPFDKQAYFDKKVQTATHDRLLDDSRLYGHRIGLENPGVLTRIETYKDMVHVHQLMSLLFESSRVATANIARFIERSIHLRDQQEIDRKSVGGNMDTAATTTNGATRSASVLNKVSTRDPTTRLDLNQKKMMKRMKKSSLLGKGAQEVEGPTGSSDYVPAFLRPGMIFNKSSQDGVEWVMVEMNGKEYPGDEGWPMGVLIRSWPSAQEPGDMKED
ncbi:hypothetical protein BGZ83_008028 [Gryganskiella cystojenkinii]|nr:hypothetical protein BGZ83_008028 [Gryganskiella cystojenkinii]